MTNINNPQDKKVIVACTSCNTQYNVSKLQPGTKFRCNKCETINTTPTQIQRAAPPPRPVVKPAPQSTAQRKPVASFRKAGKLKVAPPTKQDDGSEQQEPRYDLAKSKKTNPAIIIIGIAGGLIAAVICLVYLFSLEEEPLNVVTDPSAAQTHIAEETTQREATPEQTAIIQPVEEKKEVKKRPQKQKLDIDKTLQAEIQPILAEMRKMGNEELENKMKLIIAKGKKIIPILIKEIGGKDEWAARYANDILKKMTNWAEAPNVTPMVGEADRYEDSKEWEEWWFENKDSIPD